MKLEPGWEKKALIVLAVITAILLIYGYGSMKITSNNTTNQTIEQPMTPEPQSTSPIPNSTPNSNNTTSSNLNTSSNGTSQANETKIPIQQVNTGSAINN